MGRGTRGERRRRLLAAVLSGILLFESAFGNGLTTAFADSFSTDQSTVEETQGELPQTDAEQDTDSAEGAADVRTEGEPWDWTDDPTHLSLCSTNGLSIDYESAKLLVDDKQEDATSSSGDGAAEDAPALDNLLPSQLPATLDLSFELDPTAHDDAGSPAAPSTAEPGDYFLVSLPGGVTLSNEKAVDLFLLDENDELTTTRVAEAVPQADGSLKVSLVENAYAQADPEAEGPAASAEQPPRASATIQVNLSSELLSDDATELVWALQGDPNDESQRQTVALHLPGAAELAERLGIDPQPVTPDEGKAPEDSAPEGEEKPEYTPVTGESTSETLTITWADNNDSGSRRPTTAAVEDSLTLSFTSEGIEGDIPLTPESAEKYFGLDAEALGEMLSVRKTGVGTYVAEATGLFSAVTTSAGEELRVSWGLSYDGDKTPDGYHRSEAADGSIVFQLLGTSTYHLEIKAGEESHDITSELFDGLVIVGGGDEVSVRSLGEQLNERGMSLVWDEKAGTFELTAPAFGADGLPIEYCLKHDPQVQQPNPDDGYEYSYDNAASANHGSNTTEAYDGGTLTITRVGLTSFHATKAWLDGESAASRPTGEDITFTLWRYTSNGGSAASASQITDASGSFVTLTTQVSEEDTIDIGALLRQQYPELELEKYDNDGYAYYYAVREETSFKGYERVYGAVSDDGTVTDTAPNYDKKGQDSPAYDEDWTRDEGLDRLVYNGGTISNRLTGERTVAAEKEWVAAAFADQLADVTCEFTLQARAEGTDNPWQSTGITETLSAFAAESLTKDLSKTCDMYDSHGNRLEYRWVETDVTQKIGAVQLNSSFTEAKEGEDGHLYATFSLWLRKSDDGSSSVGDVPDYEWVTFASEMWVDEDDPDLTHVRNTFTSTVDEKVEKKWAVENEGGTLEYLESGDSEIPEHKLTIAVFDGDVKLAEATLDGNEDAEKTPLTMMEDIDPSIEKDFEAAAPTFQETSPDVLEIFDLPLYKSDGSRYNYRIMEVSGSPDGWDTRQAYDAGNHLTTIINTKGRGERTIVLLEKDWIEGGDSAHRLSARIEGRGEQDIKNAAGTTVYKVGDVIPVSVLNADGTFAKEAESVLITEDRAWFTTIAISGASNIPLEALDIRETSLVASAGDAQTSYEVVSYEEATADGSKYKDEEWVNYGWGHASGNTGFENAQYERVATDEHVYEVRYSSLDAEKSPFGMLTYRVTNRRIGLINIDVTKTWKDGNRPADGRSAAVYRLTCSDDGAEFRTDDSGAITIQLFEGNELPLFSEDAKLSGADVPERLTGEVEDGGRTLVVKVPADGGIVEFCGLPKYNGRGEVVSYSVTEEWAENSDHANYPTSTVLDPYEVGHLHFNDTLSYGVTNSLVGTRDVVFYKQWNDQYVSDADTPGQRPDISLGLYRVSAKQGSTPEAVPGYINWSWEALEKGGETSRYEWRVTAPSLPRYDSEGYAYTYYAVENMPEGAQRLDYQDVTFSPDRALDGWNNGEGLELSEVDLWKVGSAQGAWEPVKDAAGTEAGTSYAMRERGTFVNSLANTQLIQGTKIWENVPGDVDANTQLPDILVLVQRRLMGDTTWPEAYVEKDVDGAWGPTDETVEKGGVVAWTDELSQVEGSKTTYSFTVSHEGYNNGVSEDVTPLPRYDDLGRRYEYRAIEVITGISGSPAASGVQLTNVDVAADGVDLTGGLYTVQHGEAGSFLLRNTLASEKGSLTVKKIVEQGDRADADSFPDVTFTLCRYDPSDPDGEESAQKVGNPITVKDSEFKAASTDGSGIAEVTRTFEDLDVFTPRGEYWHYYVVESAINGYTTTVGMGDLSAAAVTDGDTASPVAMDGDKTLVADDEAVDVTFRNTYHKNAATLTLTGQKHWYDLGNAFDTRPDEIELSLVRYTSAQAEETVSLVSDDSAAEGYVTWDKTSDSDTWTYTIRNLEQWAPDGRAWTYKVTETLAEDNVAYKVVTGDATVTAEDANADGAYAGTFRTLENRLAGSATVKKVWEDGDNEWALRPLSVTVELQARASNDGGSTWGDWGNAASVLGTDKISATVELTAPSWSHSWDALPYQVKGQDGSICQYQYRVVETKVGDREVANFNDPVSPTDGTLSITYPLTASYNGVGETALSTSQDATNNSQTSTSATTITNTLEATKVEVTKQWQDDANKWGLRPGSDGQWEVTYYLQRAVEAQGSEDLSWSYVLDGKNGYARRTVTGDLAGSSHTEISVVTGDDGSVDIQEGLLVVGDSYVVEEVASPKGYEVHAGSFTFTVTNSGGIVAGSASAEAGPGEAGYSIVDNGLTLVMADKPIDIVLLKLGTGAEGDSAPLAGAEFEISSPEGKDAFGKELWSSWSDERNAVRLAVAPDGTLDLTGGLVQGNVYTLSEVKAPADYELLAESLTFRVEADGSIVPESDALPHGFALSNKDGLVTITVTDRLVEARILKAAADDETPLAGAEFSVRPAEGSAFGEVGLRHIGAPITMDGSIRLTTDAEGTIDLVGLLLPGNRYVVTETQAPAGYKPIGPVTVAVDQAGELSIVDEKGEALDEPYSPSSGIGSYQTKDENGLALLVVRDEAVAVDLVKLGQGQKPLAGAELTVEPVSGFSFADGTSEPVKLVTGEDGRATLAGLLVIGAQYTVREAAAPAGYELNAGSVTFTVASDGLISLVGEQSDGFEIGGGHASVVVTDTRIELGLEKVSTQGVPLSGATFDIRGVFANGDGGEETRRYTVGTDGRLELLDLVGGSRYTLTEVTAPSGYRVISEPFELVVGADGTIDAEDTSVAQGGGRTPGYYVADDGLTIVAVDEPRPWSPPSTDDPDEPGTDDPDEPGTDEPEDPEEPGENEPGTDDPSDPGNPGTDEPGTPTDPEAPTGPGDPGNPGAGDVPVKPGTSAAGDARPQTPDTGDRTNAALPVAVAFLGAVLIAGALFVRRRMRE